MDSGDPSTDNAESWKEQLGYVSGTVLGVAILLLQLWPILARSQTGEHLDVFASRQAQPTYAFVLYAPLRLGIALGLGMILFGAVHIIGRGLWLTRYSLDAPTSSRLSERISRRAYVVLYIYWLLVVVAVLFTPVSLLYVWLQRWLVGQFGLSNTTAGVVLVVSQQVVLLVVTVLLVGRYRRGIAERFRGHIRRLRWSNYLIAMLTLFALNLFVVEFCYTVAVRVDKVVIAPSHDARVIIFVELGGSTSDPKNAILTVSGRDRPPQKLMLRALDEGTYIASIPVSTLSAGDYRVQLVYPQPSLTPAFPFIRGTVRQTTGFAVIP